MITLIKYGVVGGGEKYNAKIMYIDGLSDDTKPTGTFEGAPIPNASIYTEIDTGKEYTYDSVGAQWYDTTTSGGGGGGGGTTNYAALSNKPQINGTTLSGDKTSADLGLQGALTQTQLGAVNSGVTANSVNVLEDILDSGEKNIIFNGCQSYTSGSFTCTVNANGSITLNGTVPSSMSFLFTNLFTGAKTIDGAYDNVLHFPQGNYRIATSSREADVYLQIIAYNTSSSVSALSLTDAGDGSKSFTVDNTYAYNFARIRIIAGKSFSNFTFMPFVCTEDAWLVSKTVTPYRMTTDEITSALNGKQNTIDSSHKLSADNVDDTNTTNKFATAAELAQIETNKNNILMVSDELECIYDVDSINLFDGNYITGIKIQGNTSYEIIADNTFNSMALIPVKPNTTYSVIVADGGVETTGYYYFKIAAIQSNIQTVSDLIGISNRKIYDYTSGYKKSASFTTQANDTYILIQASMTKQPYMQVSEGNFGLFNITQYNTPYAISNINKPVYIQWENTNTYRINFGDYNLKLFYTESAEADQYNWNIGTVCKGSNTLIPTGTDIIGPIKIDGESDFISGIHGSSTTTTINVLADGEVVTLDTALVKSCKQLVIQMIDECRSVTSLAHVFDRYVTLNITANKIHATVLYKCVSETSLTVERATNGGLIAAHNTILKSTSMNNKILTTAPTTSISNASKNNICATLCTDYGDMTVRNIQGHDNSSYRGFYQVFTNETPVRTKTYFDVMRNESVSNGQEISGEFEYIFS